MKIRASIFTVMMIVCALFLPWWGTPIAVAISYFALRLSTRVMCSITFVAWIAACLIRDVSNDFGPSRVLARMLSLTSFGFPGASIFGPIIVYVVVGAIGSFLALFTGGFLKSVWQLKSQADERGPGQKPVSI